MSGLTVEDFWIWAYADLLTNTVRNAFAEFMVGFSLGCLNKPRGDQNDLGFMYRDRLVAVKAAAYTQSEPQSKKSKINFDIAVKKKSRGQLIQTNRPNALRPSDCYVFCLFTYDNYNDKDAARNALIDTNHWTYFVVPTDYIDEELERQKTVGVRWLEQNSAGGPTEYFELKDCVDYVLGFSDE